MIWERLFSLILALYPKEFRERFGAEMRDHLTAVTRASELSPLGRAARAFWMIVDLVLRVPLAHRLRNQAPAEPGSTGRRAGPLETVAWEARLALRSLRRTPGFSAIVVATLALGLGANAAMFGAVDRLVFRPLNHLRDPGSVHRMYWQWQADRGPITPFASGPYARYLDMERWTRSFSQLAAFSERMLRVGDGERTRERQVGAVSASFFDFFEAQPAMGRFFDASEDVTPRGADVVVLSYGFWQSEYGGGPVLGESLTVGNIRATIVGVAPRGFDGVDDTNPPAVFVPITTYAASTGTDDARTYFTRYVWGWVRVLARLAPGVSPDQARADATRAFRRSWTQARLDNSRMREVDAAQPRVILAPVRPGAGPAPSMEARTALWVQAVALIVLVIAWANTANLFLLRALRQQRETAVRLALGTRRRRLAIRPVVEGLTLALSGCLLALVLAQGAGSVAGRLLGAASPDAAPVWRDGRTLAFIVFLTLTSGLVVGLIPALTAGRGDLTRAFRAGPRGRGRDGARLRTGLLAVQVTLSFVLLVGAGLFVKSLSAVQTMRIGFEPDRVLMVTRVIADGQFEDSIQLPLRDELLARAQALPVVESAAWISSAPIVSTSGTTLYVEGIDSVGLLGSFTYQATTPDYFRTMGTQILKGRSLTAEDRFGAPLVTVVSESMASVLWPGEDPLGRCIRMRSPDASCHTVVGVAEDIIQRSITQDERYQYYLSADQFRRSWGRGMFLKLRGDPAQEAEDIRATLQRAMPGSSYVTVQPLSDVTRRAQRSWRLGATMFVAFGLLALAVSAVGLYGAIRYAVDRRMHELGVRVALGAGRQRILGLVLRRSLWLMGIGVAVGIAAARVAAPWIQPVLFHQSATDPRVYVAVAGLLLLVVLGASALPALRAARADPTVALRSE